MGIAHSIIRARPSDLARLPAIELAAAQLLVGYAPTAMLNETIPRLELEAAQAGGLLWVAVADDTAVGFAYVKHLEPDVAHLEELDVHPDHGRRGLGRRLVTAVCDWAAASGLRGVTLCTFREPPWNMPFYASLGFEAIATNEQSEALARLFENDTRRGLDPARRVVMRRHLGRCAT